MLKTKKEIKEWLDFFQIENYTIKDDLSIDVDGKIMLVGKDLKELPVQFGLVTGEFNVRKNLLTNLKGCPRIVGGVFKCADNQLKNLEHSPEIVGDDFFCHNNPLETLQGVNTRVGGGMIAYGTSLTTLEGFKGTVVEEIWLGNTAIKTIPLDLTIKGTIVHTATDVPMIEGLENYYVNHRLDLNYSQYVLNQKLNEELTEKEQLRKKSKI